MRKRGRCEFSGRAEDSDRNSREQSPGDHKSPEPKFLVQDAATLDRKLIDEGVKTFVTTTAATLGEVVVQTDHAPVAARSSCFLRRWSMRISVTFYIILATRRTRSLGCRTLWSLNPDSLWQMRRLDYTLAAA